MNRKRVGKKGIGMGGFLCSFLAAAFFLGLISQTLWLHKGYTDMLIQKEENLNGGMYARMHSHLYNDAYRMIQFFAKSLSSYAYVEENYESFIQGENRDDSEIPLLSYMIGQNAKNQGSPLLAQNSLFGEEYIEEEKDTEEKQESLSALEKSRATVKKLYDNPNYETLIKNFYIVDSSTRAVKSVFDAKKLLNQDMKLEKTKEPQILIYHTHGDSECFADSRPNDKSESVVGVGQYLAEILQDNYGYRVIHDDTEYDRVNGKIDRNKAYNQALDGVEKWLKKYPSLQILIDLHRDGVGKKVVRTTTVNGEKTAQVMFFNGLSRTRKGKIKYLNNKNLQANLAFSLQCKLAAMNTYPDFTKPVYLKSYRYNLHLRERSLLIELGNENNTLKEAKNAMPPLADVLNQVLSGDSAL